MFSNPNHSHPDHSAMMGDSNEYNACVVYHMWDYVSRSSDAYNYGTIGYAIDSSHYTSTACPTL